MGVQRPKYAMVGSWHRFLRRLPMFGVAFHLWQVVFSRIHVRCKRVCTMLASCNINPFLFAKKRSLKKTSLVLFPFLFELPFSF
jgi:hypothetical protein